MEVLLLCVEDALPIIEANSWQSFIVPALELPGTNLILLVITAGEDGTAVASVVEKERLREILSSARRSGKNLAIVPARLLGDGPTAEAYRQVLDALSRGEDVTACRR